MNKTRSELLREFADRILCVCKFPLCVAVCRTKVSLVRHRDSYVQLLVSLLGAIAGHAP